MFQSFVRGVMLCYELSVTKQNTQLINTLVNSIVKSQDTPLYSIEHLQTSYKRKIQRPVCLKLITLTFSHFFVKSPLIIFVCELCVE